MRKTFLQWIRRIGGSLFFLGYIPLASGTIGSFVVVALLWYFREDVGRYFTPQYAVTFWLWYLIFCAVSIFFSNDSKELYGAEDAPKIIIDECAGQIITFYLHPLSWRVLLLGFFLFRFYDIVKPFPVYKFEEIEDGLGVTMDDVVAGILANVSLFVIIWMYHAIKAQL
jgi:phosphatidylglycerophosphatase A